MYFIAVIVALCMVQASEAKHKFHKHNCKVNVTKWADCKHLYKPFLDAYFPDFKPDNSQASRDKFKGFMKCCLKAQLTDPNETGVLAGLTKMCHLTDEEFNNRLNPHVDADSAENAEATKYASSWWNMRQSTPASFSWVDQGKVCSVKDQGDCGSCYTFAAAAALESAYAIKYNVPCTDFSTQQLVDCSYGYTAGTRTTTSYTWVNNAWVSTTTVSQYWSATGGNNQGCSGGAAKSCWAYYNMTGSSANTWNCYSYAGVRGTCQYNRNCGGPSVSVKGYAVVPQDENAMKQALLNSPLACAMDANVLQSYISGIIYASSCTTKTNHAVTIVGYGTDPISNTPYWLVKNSWGADWGESGYFRLAYGTNTCGITSNCAYPIVN